MVMTVLMALSNPLAMVLFPGVGVETARPSAAVIPGGWFPASS